MENKIVSKVALFYTDALACTTFKYGYVGDKTHIVLAITDGAYDLYQFVDGELISIAKNINTTQDDYLSYEAKYWLAGVVYSRLEIEPTYHLYKDKEIQCATFSFSNDDLEAIENLKRLLDSCESSNILLAFQILQGNPHLVEASILSVLFPKPSLFDFFNFQNDKTPLYRLCAEEGIVIPDFILLSVPQYWRQKYLNKFFESCKLPDLIKYTLFLKDIE